MGEHDSQGRTDRLETLLEMAVNLKHTGLCSVERGKGGVRQFGKLVFLDGQLVDATSDERKGLEAWEWLKTWSFCHYVFVSKPREEIYVPVLPEPQNEVSTSPTSPLDVFSQVIGRVAQSLSENLVPSPKSSDPITQPPVVSFNGTLSPNQVPSQYAFRTDTPVNTPRNANVAYPTIEQEGPQTPNNNQWYNHPSPSVPSPSVLAPSRLLDGDEALYFIEKYQLSRQHRHIFFLLDGQRSTIDIVRLTRRPRYEVQHILEDLEQFGLISLSQPQH